MTRIAILIGALGLASAAPQSPVAEAPLGLFSVKIGVKDFERTIAFYSALGMAAGRRYNDSEWELKWVSPAHGSSIVMVRPRPGPNPAPPGVSSFLIEVPDARAVANRLRGAGFPAIGEPRYSAMAVTVILKDPDGNIIEMVSPPLPKPPSR
jgi:predicted enzyme related to lactoylglutathione lyase